MNLRSIRLGAQIVFSLLLAEGLALALTVLLVAPFRWAEHAGVSLLLGLGISLFFVLTLIGWSAWVTGDARQRLKEVHRAHRKTHPGPDGDMTEVVAAPDPPPWTGVVH
jgi:hypothetical protein